MPTNQEQLTAAQNSLNELQMKLFFRKLASFGVKPQTREDAQSLWQAGINVLEDAPLTTEKGRLAKQASCDAFHDTASALPQEGYSQEAIKIAEHFMQIPEYVKAARLVVAVSQA
jgi:hypothetical protein